PIAKKTNTSAGIAGQIIAMTTFTTNVVPMYKNPANKTNSLIQNPTNRETRLSAALWTKLPPDSREVSCFHGLKRVLSIMPSEKASARSEVLVMMMRHLWAQPPVYHHWNKLSINISSILHCKGV